MRISYQFSCNFIEIFIDFSENHEEVLENANKEKSFQEPSPSKSLLCDLEGFS